MSESEKATQIAMRRAVESIMYKILSSKYRSDKFFVLIDGFNIKHIRKIGLKNQKGIIKGTGRVFRLQQLQ